MWNEVNGYEQIFIIMFIKRVVKMQSTALLMQKNVLSIVY